MTIVPPAANPAALLALDTSGATARVALFAPDGACLAADERTSARHSATLLPLCHELLARAGLEVSALRGIACGSGPGSFTGLRVGFAVSKGLALALDLPLLLVPSLTALAHDLAAATDAALFAPCIDAGKGEIYLQLFARTPSGPVALGPEVRATPTHHASLLTHTGQRPVFAGTGADRHAAVLAAATGADAVLIGFPGPSARSIAALALPRWSRGEHDDLGAAVPVYGRPPDITTPKRPA